MLRHNSGLRVRDSAIGGRRSAFGRRRVRVLAGAVLATALAMSAGCRQDMHQAPRYDPLEASDFFADGRASRPIVGGTIARGFLRADPVFYTGKQGATFVADLPVPITRDLVKRGQGRYNIYCSPCHGVTGDGNGMIVQRGFKQPTSYHSDRLRAQPAGYIYDVITNGFGAMQDYSAQIAPADRWAVVAYVRTLQFSRNVKAADLPAPDRERLDGKAPEGGQTHD